MGVIIPPTSPTPTECPGNCGGLPNVLSGRIAVPGMEDFVGIVTQDLINPCLFAGILVGQFANTPLFATFCVGGSDDLQMISAGPIAAQCGGVILAGIHHTIPASGISAGNCIYSVC